MGKKLNIQYITVKSRKCYSMYVDDFVLRKGVKKLMLEEKDSFYKQFVDKVDKLSQERTIMALQILANVDAKVNERGLIEVTSRTKKLDLNTIFK